MSHLFPHCSPPPHPTTPKPSFHNNILKEYYCDLRTSGQDGGIGRYALHPHIMKRRTTTNLRTKTNQNCQKIELYGSLTTKELKKTFIQTSRRGGDGQLGQRRCWARQWLVEQAGEAAAGGLGSPTLGVDKPGGTTGQRDRPCNPGFLHWAT